MAGRTRDAPKDGGPVRSGSALRMTMIGRSSSLALSEPERHELARLEKQLTSDDPQFAASFSASEVEEPSKDPLVFGLILIAIGTGILLVGVAATAVILALTGVIAAVIELTRKALHFAQRDLWRRT